MSFARPLRLAVAAGLVAAIAGCGMGAAPAQPVTFPPDRPGPSTPTTAAVAQVRADIARVLGDRSLQLDDPVVPYRPAESPRLTAAPRAVFQVVLPTDRAHGFISVYELRSAPEAFEAGREQATYISSGPGRVQFPPDTRFVLRQIGTTVVFFAWSPENSPDPRAAEIQPALETLGIPIPIPG